MRILLLACLALLLLVAPALAESLEHDGRERDYRLRLPPGEGRVPLILVLHGGGGSARQIERHSGMTEAALAAGYAVAYPDGIGGHWNDGRSGDVTKADREAVDDVGFLVALVERLVAEGRVDPARVYVMGISNGGMMTLTLACEAAATFAAGVAIVASLPESLVESCDPARPFGVMLMNGTDDPLVPYGGGPVEVLGRERGSVISTDATLELFAAANGCGGWEAVPLLDTWPGDGVTPEHEVYLDCEAPVELVRFVGGGHGWPGASQYFGERLIGVVPEGPPANALALAFFAGLR